MEYPGRLAMVPTDLVRLDETYQRSLDADRIESMVRDFVPYIFQPLALSEREDGSIYCFDGQHRLSLARRLRMPEVPGSIFKLTQAQEAAYFRDLQRRAKRLTAFDDWRAGVVAGDEECLVLDEVTREAGFEFVGRPSVRARRVRAVHAVRRIYRAHSADVLRTTLRVLTAWDGQPDQCHNEAISGVGLFIARRNGDLDVSRLMDRLSDQSPTLLLQRAMAEAGRRGTSHGGYPPYMAAEVNRVYRRAPRTVVTVAA